MNMTDVARGATTTTRRVVASVRGYRPADVLLLGFPLLLTPLRVEWRLALSAAASSVAFWRLNQLHLQASTCPLTGLLTRRPFLRALDAELRRARRQDQPVSVIRVDIDNLKQINDRHGHEAGDEVLKALAITLEVSIRDGIDAAARIGGDEFVVLLPDMDSDKAAEVAERIRRAFRTCLFGFGRASASFGVAAAPQDAICPLDLLAAADTAAYAAKNAGRDTVSTVPTLST